jgi:S-adenosylmethionine decarboxylase
MSQLDRIRLQGFNNLTKTLGFNVYDINYAATPQQERDHIRSIDAAYNADRLTEILHQVAGIIGANVLNVAQKDYEPHGASAALLISEEAVAAGQISHAEAPGRLPEAVVAHLDKSHITAHTYPESRPEGSVSTFRADIDVSTCGRVSPLKALNCLLHSFEPDVVILDYRVRGFTRDELGRKHYIDHRIHSIQDFLAPDTRARYQMVDVNLYQDNIFHTRMIRKEFDLARYLCAVDRDEVPPERQRQLRAMIRREMLEIFHGRNLGSAMKLP